KADARRAREKACPWRPAGAEERGPLASALQGGDVRACVGIEPVVDAAYASHGVDSDHERRDLCRQDRAGQRHATVRYEHLHRTGMRAIVAELLAHARCDLFVRRSLASEARARLRDDARGALSRVPRSAADRTASLADETDDLGAGEGATPASPLRI